MSTTLGTAAAKKRIYARAIVKPTGLGYYLDVGNILKIKPDKEIKTVDHLASDPLGFKVVDRTDVTTAGWKYDITFDEEHAHTRRLLYRTLTAATTATQTLATAPDGTITFTAVALGGTYFLGVYNATSIVVKVGEVTKTITTDYTIDAITGALTIVGAGISAGNDVIVTWGCPAETRDSYTSLDAVQCDGDFIIFELDRYGTGPRQITSFSGTCWVSNDGTNDGDKFSEYGLTIRAFTKPTIIARQ